MAAPATIPPCTEVSTTAKPAATVLSLPTFTPDCPARAADTALKHSLAVAERAQHGAVLWFGEIQRRRLYRELGYSSMPQYARKALGFSESKSGDFMRLARKLDALPAVRAAVATGEIGYTKAREIIKVASPRTEKAWLATAREASRAQLAARVKQVRARAARRCVGQLELGAGDDPDQGATAVDPTTAAGPMEVVADDGVRHPAGLDDDALAREIPVRIGLEFTPEQHARWEALWERLQRLGAVPAGRAEGVLDALAALAEAGGGQHTTSASSGRAENCEETTPRGAVPVTRIHLHHCPACARTSVVSGRGEHKLDRPTAERAACDATVIAPDGRRTSTVPPRVRRQVLARDRHRCTASGCGRTRFLEIHHVVPRHRGGAHTLDNLVTLCSACHQLHHQRC